MKTMEKSADDHVTETAYYQSLTRTGRLTFWTDWNKFLGSDRCAYGNCDWPRHARGLCKHHYTDVYNGNPFRDHGPYAEANLPICKSSGCEKPVHGCGYCKSHHAAYLRVHNVGYPYSKNLLDAQAKLAQAEAEMNRYRVWRYRQMLRIDGLV